MSAWKCSGCHAKNAPEATACENCGMARVPERVEVVAPAAAPQPFCRDCGVAQHLRELTPGEDGVDRCNDCHMVYLRQRASPDDDPEVVRAKAELRRILDANAVKWGSRR